jgi:hypothetical protein
MERRTFSLKAALVLGVVGAALHLLSVLRSGIRDATDPSAPLAFGPIVVSTYVLLGAILYGALLGWPVTRAIYDERLSFFTVLGGGFFGMLATIVALQGSYIAVGCVLTHLARVTYPVVRAGSIKSTFSIMMIPVETYGLLLFFRCMIPAFLSGMLITALARLFHSRSAPSTAA